MYKKLKEIYISFDGKLVGSSQMKMYVCKTLSKMPEEIIDTITKSCWFLGSLEDAWSFTFTGNDIKDQHLIFISDELLRQDDTQIQHTIAHEIGHVILKHRNSILVEQSKAEIKRQETEADEFAQRYS